MSRLHRIRIPLAIVCWLALVARVAPAQRLCSAGERDGQPCTQVTDCPGGTCVLAQGVCSGGADDGLDCDCPSGTCSDSPACASDPALGSCNGGLLAGRCCDPAFNCASGNPCVPTQKVCLSGPLKGLPCLQDTHCLGAVCWATGRVCGDGSACVDDDDCLMGTCEGTGSFPTPTPTTATRTPTPSSSPSASRTPTPRPNCTGDCSRDGTVTIDEILLLVNIALGQAPIARCQAADSDGNEQITVEEIVSAVSYALTACPATVGESSG